MRLLLELRWSAPGYIGQVWNLKALSDVVIYRLPPEELLRGSSFGLAWTGIYEHYGDAMSRKTGVVALGKPSDREQKAWYFQR